MATLSQSIKQTAVLDSGETYTNSVSTKTVTLTTVDGLSHHTTQEVAGHASSPVFEALSVGDITIASKYFVTLRNLGDQADTPAGTLEVNLSTSTAGSAFLTLEPGELAGFPVKGGVNVFLKSATLSTDIEVDVVVTEG